MGINIGYVMGNQIPLIPDYTHYNTESFFTRSLEMTNQFNEEMRMYHLEFFSIDQLNESVQSVILSKIGTIFKNIIAFIKKIKDAIISAINEFKRKLQKKKTENNSHLGSDILQKYTKDDYFSMSIYSNTLSDAFLNKNDPPMDLDFIPEKKFESMQDFIFSVWDGTPNSEEAIKNTNDLLEEYKGIVNNVFYKLVGTVSHAPEMYKDKAKFKEILTNKFIGKKTEREINNIIAVTASTNMEVYSDLINNFDKMHNSVNKTYSGLEKRLDTFRTNMFTIISNPEKYTDTEEYQKMVTKIATMAITISTIITDICNMHLNTIGIKLDCINTMLDQDNAILDKVKKIINKGKVDESFVIDTDDSLDIASRELYEACLNYQDALSNLNFVNELSIIAEADGDQQQQHDQGQQNNQQQTAQQPTQQQTTTDKDQKLATNNKSSIKDRAIELFRKAVENLKNMWNKFLEKVKQFTERPWLQNNKDALLKLQFPKSNEGLEDWTTFNTDLIKQKLQLPVFDPNNSQLMKDLESDDTFSKTVYKAIGGNFESKIASDASYIDHCKGLYGIKENDGKIGLDKVQPMIKDMVEYCEQFLSDGSNSITASIRNDMTQLDRSKKIIEQAIKEEKKNISSADKKVNNNTQQQTGQNQQQSKGSEDKVEESFSAAAIFGLIGVNEVKMPTDVEDATDTEKANQKQAITNAGDGTTETLNKIDEKAMRYFRMVGNAVGARMTQSVACYRQYISVLKWGLKLQK